MGLKSFPGQNRESKINHWKRTKVLSRSLHELISFNCFVRKIKSRAPRLSFQTTAGHPHDQIITSFGTNKEEEVDIGSDLPSSYHELYESARQGDRQQQTTVRDSRPRTDATTWLTSSGMASATSSAMTSIISHGDGSHQRATVKVPSRLIAHSLGIYGDSQQCSSTVDLCVRSPTAGFSTFLEDKTIKNGRSCEERYKFDRDDWWILKWTTISFVYSMYTVKYSGFATPKSRLLQNFNLFWSPCKCYDWSKH